MSDTERAIVSAHLGTTRWMIAPRLTDRMADEGWRVAITQGRIDIILKKALYSRRNEEHDSITEPGEKP